MMATLAFNVLKEGTARPDLVFPWLRLCPLHSGHFLVVYISLIQISELQL